MESRFRYHSQDGLERVIVHDDADGPYKFRVHTKLQMDGILSSVERDRDNIRPGSTNKLVARVPMTVYEQSLHEGWDENDWKKWLNDPDNKAFRIWPGQV